MLLINSGSCSGETFQLSPFEFLLNMLVPHGLKMLSFQLALHLMDNFPEYLQIKTSFI